MLEHEARRPRDPGRDLRDLGDGLLLFDPGDPDPFWNRLRERPLARRARPISITASTEAMVHFAARPAAAHLGLAATTPPDLVARLQAAGFTMRRPG